jgi:choline dehydrogenase-like flavoprotein
MSTSKIGYSGSTTDVTVCAREVEPVSIEPVDVDYVVVGGGSAGSIVAAELARAGDASVLLLEHGDPAESHPETLHADGYKDAFANDALIWERFSVPQAQCGRQRLFMGSGRGLGGSGSVNGMVYTRGSRRDYDEWPEGWRWDDLVPDFTRVEEVLRVRRRAPTRFTSQFVEAAREAGFRIKEDLNDGDLEGVFGHEHMNYEGDRRRSSYVAFVKDAPRPNLQVRTGACVERVLFAGKRAVGVRYRAGGQIVEVRARAEVVLCAGALESPKLLLLSGVGPADELARHGIPVVHESPEVGHNLHDHPNVTLFFRGQQDVDANYPQLYGFHRANRDSALPAGQSDTCYVAYPARSSFKQAAMRMLPTKLPLALYGAFTKWLLRTLIALLFLFGFVRRFIERAYGIVVILGKPKSRGRLRLASSDAAAQAEIDPAYFREREDLETMVRGVRLAYRIAGAAPLVRFGNRPLLPNGNRMNDAALARWIEKNAMTTFHYCGTCRMGSDAGAVVDTELRVRGVTGLRVADASVVPSAPVSAMNAPSMVIGYRAARAILQARTNGQDVEAA